MKGVVVSSWSMLTVAAFSIVAAIILGGGGVVEGSHKVYSELQSATVEKVEATHRTAYHFQPPKHWINDPNGPMYFNGFYHLFYQYNPKGAVWGNIVWAHSISRDLINWASLEPAIKSTKPFDIGGCWSGSVTILPNNKPVIMYTGLDKHERQLQNFAVPKNISDPFLREWAKPDFGNPFINPDPLVNASAFRDPTTAWFANGKWNTVVGGKYDMLGVAFLYQSRDFKKWVKADHPLHAVWGTGMWECPDFFPVSVRGEKGLDTSAVGKGVKHVFKVSLDLTRFEYYTIGVYDRMNNKYVPDKGSVDSWAGLRYDYGNFYASKSFFDHRKNRRVLWGWANESDDPNRDQAKGWAGIQLIPRKVWLDPNGKQLLQWPIEELERLRTTHPIRLNLKSLKKGQLIRLDRINAAQVDVEVTFSFKSLDKAEQFDPKWANLPAQDVCNVRGSTIHGGLGPFGLLTLASKKLEEYTPVMFRVFKRGHKHVVLFCSDAKRLGILNPRFKSIFVISSDKLYKPSFAGYVDVDLSRSKKISLRSLIDHSVVESFAAGGKTVITSRVYPTLAIQSRAHLFLFNNGTEEIKVDNLTAWNVRKPVMNVPLEEAVIKKVV
ncbi:Beta-fructofuranosidase, insoluble isoenzyme 1 [Linum perenne]